MPCTVRPCPRNFSRSMESTGFDRENRAIVSRSDRWSPGRGAAVAQEALLAVAAVEPAAKVNKFSFKWSPASLKLLKIEGK